MGSLSGQYISESFVSLIHIGTNNTASATFNVLQDGLGNSLGVSVNTIGEISASGNIYGLNITGSTIATGSFVTTSSFNAYTASQSTASLVTSISNLNTATASLFTSASLGLTTASVNINVITFTKGNGTTFDVAIAASGSVAPGTVSGSAQIVALGFLQTSSFNAYTASNNQRVSSLETNSASVNTSISALNTFTASQSTASLVTSITNLNTFSASALVSISNINSTTASLLVETQNLELFSASALISISNLNASSASQQISIDNLNTNSASVNTSVTNINSATASLFTSASLALTTASVNLNTITFTKGDGTTFPITVNTGSGGGGTTNTGSLLLTASAFINTITFTKGDGTTFPVTVTTGSLNYVTGSFGAFYDTTTQSGSAGVAYSMKLNNTDISDGVIISGSGGIKVLAAGTYDLQFSAQVLADTGSDTVWIWLKKNGTNVPDTSTKLVLANNEADVAAWNFVVSANANDVFELAWQSSGGHTKLFAEAAASNYTAIPSVIATMNRVDVGGGTNLISTASFNSYTSSNDQKVNSLIAATGSYATTGSNNFIGVQTINDVPGGGTGEVYLLARSGSLVLGAQPFTPTYAALSHLSSSTLTNINLIFKTNTNTADTIISGSGNMFFNPAAPTAGFKRYLGLGNIALNGSNVPQISGSMAFSPTMNNNYWGGSGTTLIMRGPVSSSAWTISGNSVLGTINIGSSATLHAEKLTAGLTMTGNIVAGTISLVANQSALTGSTTTVSNNNINGGVGLILSSSAQTFSNNNINDNNFILTNQFSSSSLGLGSSFVNQNTIGGSTNTFYITGSQLVTGFGPSLSQNFIFGQTNILFANASDARVSGSNAYMNSLSTGLMGQRLIASGSSNVNDLNSFGSVFVGRWNADDGRRNKTSDVVFAVGTGISGSGNTGRKTGFLIDSGSNTFIEGTLNVSGSTTMTGSLILSSSNAIELQVIGNSVFTGSVNGNVVALSITSNTASMDLNLGNYFTLTLADTATTHISASNVQPGVSATLVITTGTNSSASLAPTMLQPSGSAYVATNGSAKKDVLSIVAVASGAPFVVSTKNMI